MRPALLVAATLALGAGPAAAEPGDGRAAPPAETPPQRMHDLDVTGHFRATEDQVVLEVAGARFELRLLGDGTAVPAPPPAGAHDFQATFRLDGRAKSFLLRVVPPPQSGGNGSPR